ncbi:replication-relaxation family protein [Streptomyces sp. NBC_00271]|uniref:replication-relaxation family protein n=1 Tax=Streptomyces sp. NBC_00271 TaxID=2975697 RepID=UPI002E2822FB|nr:replication-relaxation family protein [Streptomyces sp. NBC_00271]
MRYGCSPWTRTEAGPGSGPARSRGLGGQRPGRQQALEPDAARAGRGSGGPGPAGRGDGRDGVCGAARSGAPHAMAVNETVIAITRTPATATRPVPRQQPAPTPTATEQASAPRGSEPQGMGWIGSWSTEVPLSLTTSRGNRAGVRADAVLEAPEAGLPVLFVEVDNCTESADTLAAKFEKYLRYFRLKSKNTLGSESPVWRTQYPSTGREGHPPVVVVFNPGTRTGRQALKNRMNTVMELTRLVWSGSYHGAGGGYGAEERDGYYGYADIPLLFTTLDRLQTSGPRTAVWWRCGHGQWETLPDALANPDDHDAWYARDEQRRRRREEAEQRRQQEWAVERERWTQEPDRNPSPPSRPRRASGAKGRSPARSATTSSSPRLRTDGTAPPAAPTCASSIRRCAKRSSDGARAASSPAPPERDGSKGTAQA